MNKEYVLNVANTIREQLLGLTPIEIVMSWGIERFTATVYKEMPALIFKVNGRLHIGNVIVALNGSDYYEVYLQDKNGTKLVCDEVCFDELGEVIDRHIERGDNQEEYDKFCENQLGNLIAG